MNRLGWKARVAIRPCVLVFAALACFSGCSTSPKPQVQPIEPVYPVERILRADVETVEVSDPWEGFNRRMYRFNYGFDKYVFLPIVHGYEFIMPDFLEDRVSNFFANLGEVNNLLNSILQFKGNAIADTIARILVNTTFGIGGLFDVATAMGVPRVNEDFGQTLGFYGIGPGPYLVLPIFGPSSLRDTAGLAVDIYVYSLVNAALLDATDLSGSEQDALNYGLLALRGIDTRHRIKFRYYDTGSPYEYELIRLLYQTKRELDIAK